MEITNTITVLKLLWVIFTFTGLLFMLLLIKRAYGDLRFLRKNHLNHLREYAAKTSLLTYLGGSYTQGLLFAAGVISLTQPNRLVTASYIAQGLYILISGIGTIIAATIYRRRVIILEMLDKEEDSKT